MSSAGPEIDLLAAIESGQAPRRILEFAARGFVPLSPSDLVRAVTYILSEGDAEMAPLAEATFQGFDVPAMRGAVLSEGIRAAQLDIIARRTQAPEVLEPLIRHRIVGNETLAWLAERIEPILQDILITNQTRLIAAPVIVERLFENPHLSTEIRRRADEFLEEFFLKREREEEEERVQAAIAAAAAREAESDAAAEAARKAAEGLAEAEEAVLSEDEKSSLFARIALMNVVQRIRLAWRGNKEERFFLIRDTNRLVSAAVLRSPKTREADAETIAGMKSVSEDVLRSIALRREWMRKYSIMWAIIRNPRSPIDVTLSLVLKLNARDMKLLSNDRNVPEAIRATARREVARKET